MGILWLIFTGIQILVLARCILSFMPQFRRHPASMAVTALTDPLLRPFQQFARVGPVDFSPMILLFILGMVRGIIW